MNKNIPKTALHLLSVLTLGAGLLLSAVAAQGQGVTPPPDRPGNNDRACPPGPGNQKATPNDPKDKDVNGDKRTDYFMGEWKFIEGDKDLVVRKWCINKPQGTNTFNDFFSFEILTSKRNEDGGFTETPRVTPGSPI